MKKYKTTLIALAVLIVAVAALFVAMKIADKDNGDNDGNGDDTQGTTSSNVSLFDFDKNNVIKLDTSYDVKFSLERDISGENKNWVCTSDETIETHNASVNAIVATLADIKGKVIEDVDDFGDYGFVDGKSDIYIKATLSDGNVYTVYVGNNDLSGSYYYLVVEGRANTVYKSPVYDVQELTVQKQDLINMKTFTFTAADKFKYFMVKSEGEKIFEAMSTSVDENDDAVWSVKHPAERNASDSVLNKRIDSMQSLPLEGITEEDCKDLARYGLDVPFIEYYLKTESTDGTETMYLIRLGEKTPEARYYYCTIDDSNTVYTVSVDYIYRDFVVSEYIDTSIFVEDSDKLSLIEFSYGDERHTMRYKYSTKIVTDDKTGEKTEETVTERYFDDRYVPDDDSYLVVTSDSSFRVPTAADKADYFIVTDNPADCFQQVLFSLYILSYQEFDETEPAEAGDVVFSVRYTKTDGEITDIQLLKRDNTTAYIYINGVYGGGYCKTTSIHGDNFDNGDIDAAVTALETVMKQVV